MVVYVVMYMHPVVLCLQDQLGEVVYVQLPEIDTELELGRKFLKKKKKFFKTQRQIHAYFPICN